MPNLDLYELLKLASIYSRTYNITVPWNLSSVAIPIPPIGSLPKIDEISPYFVCKSVKVTIYGFKGIFYGSVSKIYNLPEGYGVFITRDWIICGNFLLPNGTDMTGVCLKLRTNGTYYELVNSKIAQDGTVL